MKRLTDKQVEHQAIGRRRIRTAAEMAGKTNLISVSFFSNFGYKNIRGHIFNALPIHKS